MYLSYVDDQLCHPVMLSYFCQKSWFAIHISLFIICHNTVLHSTGSYNLVSSTEKLAVFIFRRTRNLSEELNAINIQYYVLFEGHWQFHWLTPRSQSGITVNFHITFSSFPGKLLPFSSVSTSRGFHSVITSSHLPLVSGPEYLLEVPQEAPAVTL